MSKTNEPQTIEKQIEEILGRRIMIKSDDGEAIWGRIVPLDQDYLKHAIMELITSHARKRVNDE